MQSDRGGRDRRSLTKRLRDQGFSPNAADSLADHVIAAAASRDLTLDNYRQYVEQAYRSQVDKMCAQTAHLLLARALVYRVGEDMELFEALLGGEALERALQPSSRAIAVDPTPALTLMDAVRRRMVNVLPVVFQLSDLDWWLIPQDKRTRVARDAGLAIAQAERDLEGAITRMLRTLDGYHFSKVDADVWRNVYQYYLPAEERQTLGGFYTPEGLVEFILDLAEYRSDRLGLCDTSILDPACGSGAFVTASAARLLKHLSTNLECHSAKRRRPGRTPDWLARKAVLDVVVSRVHAIDIHPFGALLTTLNLTFLLLPLFAEVKSQNPEYVLDLRVFSADSLLAPADDSAW